jgi:ABC-2 type transport system ATP-binding protein
MDIQFIRMNIDIYNLIKNYKDFSLGIKELHLNSPSVVGIVGNNGAGKTTLLKLMLDLILPEYGDIFSNNKLIRLSDHWKAYTGSFLNEDFLISFLTPIEYFNFIADIYKITQNELLQRLKDFDSFLSFDIRSKKFIREYSIGNKYKIGIVSSLITMPEIVILDEPFNFLDPSSQNQLSVILKDYCYNKNAMVLLSSHDLIHLSELCSRVIVIENGSLVHDINNLNPDKIYKELRSYFEKTY